MPYIDFQQLVDLQQQLEFEPKITWQSVARSHVGCVRKVNEDAFFHSTDHGLWVVADGMGGLARGDYASGVVVDAVLHFVKSSTIAASIRDLETRLRDAHSICRRSFEGERVGSTVAAMFSYGQFSFLVWAGDTRIYRLRREQLKQLTVDHTVAQEKFARGEISAKKASTHHTAHVLTRAVGVHQTLHLELDYDVVQPGDRFLVCSDGLYNDLTRDEILQYLKHGSSETAVDTLLEKALDKGGSDNITAIVVDAG